MQQSSGNFRSDFMPKDSLNKYKKKVQKKSNNEDFKIGSSQKTSKNQFQKYFLDTTNVFFEDRDSLKQLKTTNQKLRYLLPLWFFLSISYLIISRIQGYNGECPQNATCKVYIRCNPGYELSPDSRQCNVKASIIEQIENVCKFEIENLKLEYGDKDCVENISSIKEPPFKDVSELRQSITKSLNPQLKYEVQKKIDAFLSNKTNQMIYNFQFFDSKVIPLVKKHSLSCWFHLLSHTKQFKIVLIVLLLASILVIWWFINFKKQQKVKQIYQYLKQKVIKQTKVNVTLLSDEMKSIFGPMDQHLWIKVDDQRKKDGKIAYFQDQFLYWKLL